MRDRQRHAHARQAMSAVCSSTSCAILSDVRRSGLCVTRGTGKWGRARRVSKVYVYRVLPYRVMCEGPALRVHAKSYALCVCEHRSGV